MNIFVAKLSSSTTNDDLRMLFTEFGEVSKASIILDRDTGEPRGFGFVEMPDSAQAMNAIKTLDGASINGRNIVVKAAEDRRPAPGAGGPGGFREQRPGSDRGERGDRGFDRGSDRGSDRGADRSFDRGEPRGDRSADRGSDRGSFRENGQRPDAGRTAERDGNRFSERAAPREQDRSRERGGTFPPPSAPFDGDADFRKPSRGSKFRDLDRKRNDFEKKGSPKKSVMPLKKVPKKGRSFEDFDDDY